MTAVIEGAAVLAVASAASCTLGITGYSHANRARLLGNAISNEAHGVLEDSPVRRKSWKLRPPPTDGPLSASNVTVCLNDAILGVVSIKLTGEVLHIVRNGTPEPTLTLGCNEVEVKASHVTVTPKNPMPTLTIDFNSEEQARTWASAMQEVSEMEAHPVRIHGLVMHIVRLENHIKDMRRSAFKRVEDLETKNQELIHQCKVLETKIPRGKHDPEEEHAVEHAATHKRHHKAVFHIDEEVQFKNLGIWEDGVVTSTAPLKIRFASLPDSIGCEYEEVRHAPQVQRKASENSFHKSVMRAMKHSKSQVKQEVVDQEKEIRELKEIIEKLEAADMDGALEAAKVEFEEEKERMARDFEVTLDRMAKQLESERKKNAGLSPSSPQKVPTNHRGNVEGATGSPNKVGHSFQDLVRKGMQNNKQHEVEEKCAAQEPHVVESQERSKLEEKLAAQERKIRELEEQLKAGASEKAKLDLKSEAVQVEKIQRLEELVQRLRADAERAQLQSSKIEDFLKATNARELEEVAQRLKAFDVDLDVKEQTRLAQERQIHELEEVVERLKADNDEKAKTGGDQAKAEHEKEKERMTREFQRSLAEMTKEYEAKLDQTVKLYDRKVTEAVSQRDEAKVKAESLLRHNVDSSKADLQKINDLSQENAQLKEQLVESQAKISEQSKKLDIERTAFWEELEAVRVKNVIRQSSQSSQPREHSRGNPNPSPTSVHRRVEVRYPSRHSTPGITVSRLVRAAGSTGSSERLRRPTPNKNLNGSGSYPVLPIAFSAN